MKIAVIFCVFLFIAIAAAFIFDESPPTPEIQSIAEQARGDVESKLHEHFPEFKVVKFRKQSGRGHKYFIKIKVGNTYLHLKAYKNKSGRIGIADIDVGHTANDHLDSF